MFSQGQVVFGILFAIVFITIIIFSYRKDANLHKVFYKGNYKILIGFIVFIGLLFLIKMFLKH